MWAAVFGLALLSTAFAYLLYFTIVARAGATNASLVTLIVPVSAILLGAIFLGEHLELFEFAGIVLIAIGLLTIDGRLLPRKIAQIRLVARLIFSQACEAFFALRNNGTRRKPCRIFHNHVALQQQFPLARTGIEA